MIIVMKPHATKNEIQAVIQRIEGQGYTAHPIHGVERTVIGAIGDERGKMELQALETMAGVDRVVPILEPYKLASMAAYEKTSEIPLGSGVVIGGQKIVVIAGPCSVEGEDQVLETARIVKEAGATVLRGGAFKPRSSPYSFQGMERDGLKLLKQAGGTFGMPVITEVMAAEDVALVAEYADIVQIGARNAQNFSLLKRVGRIQRPVLLKRGLAMTIEEWLMSAEYILSHGNPNVILCERGIRTFETATRNTLDLSAVPVLKGRTHLPVIVDPSHGTGHWKYVAPMGFGAIAVGADGLMIEVHPHPKEALSDGPQSLKPQTFARFMEMLAPFAQAANRTL
jgi:3-deoxy-7-phosphoheptulonate synthase